MSETPTPKVVTIDRRKFDPLQRRILEEIIRDIKKNLENAGIEKEKLQDLSENLAFGICAIVDGSRVMSLKGEPVRPVLAFATNDQGSELIGATGGSWMHEYVMGAVEELFEEES